MIELLDIAAMAVLITLLIVMLVSIFMVVDMVFDGHVRIGKAAFLLFIAGTCIHVINMMTGY